MSTTRSTRSGSRRERGAGLIGEPCRRRRFLLFLLVAVQVTYDLYATSAVTSAAFDAARMVAAGADRVPRAPTPKRTLRRVLGRYGDRVTFNWSETTDSVVLRVAATNPGFLPTTLRRPLGVDRVERTVHARIERLR